MPPVAEFPAQESLAAPGVELVVYAPQAVSLHMGVNFCGAYVGVAKQHLHGAQVCAAL